MTDFALIFKGFGESEFIGRLSMADEFVHKSDVALVNLKGETMLAATSIYDEHILRLFDLDQLTERVKISYGDVQAFLITNSFVLPVPQYTNRHTHPGNRLTIHKVIPRVRTVQNR